MLSRVALFLSLPSGSLQSIFNKFSPSPYSGPGGRWFQDESDLIPDLQLLTVSRRGKEYKEASIIPCGKCNSGPSSVHELRWARKLTLFWLNELSLCYDLPYWVGNLNLRRVEIFLFLWGWCLRSRDLVGSIWGASSLIHADICWDIFIPIWEGVTHPRRPLLSCPLFWSLIPSLSCFQGPSKCTGTIAQLPWPPGHRELC